MNWTDAPYPVAPWDTTGLPPRTMTERCARHKHCAYRDDDPGRCPTCHTTRAKCGGRHGAPPADGGWRLGAVAKSTNATLKAGQPLHPGEAGKASSSWPQPSGGAPGTRRVGTQKGRFDRAADSCEPKVVAHA